MLQTFYHVGGVSSVSI